MRFQEQIGGPICELVCQIHDTDQIAALIFNSELFKGHNIIKTEDGKKVMFRNLIEYCCKLSKERPKIVLKNIGVLLGLLESQDVSLRGALIQMLC